MCPNVHCSTIYKSQDMETIELLISRGMDKEDVLHISVEYYSAIKMNEIGSIVETWIDLGTVI